MISRMQHYLGVSLLGLALLCSPLAARAGSGGTHLTTFDTNPRYAFDPVSEFDPSIKNVPLTLTGAGTGFLPGTYYVTVVFANFNCGAQGIHNVAYLNSPVGGAADTGPASGGSWNIAAGPPASYTLPVTSPNTALTGPLGIALAGDSLTQRLGGSFGSALASLFPNAQLSVVNDGVFGSTTAEWLPGTTNYTQLVHDINQAGSNGVQLELGTNDAALPNSVPAATYHTNMQAIVDGLYHDCPTVHGIQVQQMPYVVPGSINGEWTPASDTLIQQYNVSLASLTRVHVGSGLYAFFAAHPELLTDGVHPDPTGGQPAQIGYWQNFAVPTFGTLPNRQPAPVGSNAAVLDATAFSGTMTNTGTFATGMIARYAKVGILIAVAIAGVMLLWRRSRRTVGN